MHPDLIARTCGSIGVLGALVFIGVIDTPKFIITPQQNFESVLLSINVASAKTSEQPQEVEVPSEVVPPAPPKVEEVEAPTPKVEQLIPPPPPPTVGHIQPEKVVVPHKEEPMVKPPKKVEPPKQEVIKPKPSKKEVVKTKNSEHNTNINRKDKQTTNHQASTVNQEAKKAQASERKLNAQLASLLVKEIKSKLRYPRNAVRRKLEGTVMVEFLINDGVVISYKIEKSSGHKILDEAATKLAKSLVKFNTRLDAMNNRVLIPIKYELL